MIEIRNLSKTFDGKQVLQGIDLVIEKGDIYGLVGVSGAGKSTLLRCINGLESFDSGDLIVDSVQINRLSNKELRYFRSGIGMIFQQFSLLERKTVYENILFPLKCFKSKMNNVDQRIREVLELVELSDKINMLPRQLSGGQKQRVAIARALIMNPKILLCDEATSALDPNITQSILELLKKINRELGITIVVVTHQMSVVKGICNKMGVLSSGKLKAAGNAQEIFLNTPEILDDFMGEENYRDGTSDQKKIKLEIIQRSGENDDILSRLAIETGVKFELVWGGLSKYSDSIAGALMIRVHEEEYSRIEDYLDKHRVEWRKL
ncbi:methionine ABC transporter ATP-binding protein [Paenibacillus eucommiae]|uniref:D-methionine transport system ATP-binding protein n=1 Tax=Paenibacillus eucommiae TaxID=1355755 RepID=A0ABS4IVL5_9BACL|nr:methionine ABC transporter ATP-binding protein [Paenibacillus eucommiae]MBP1991632.1 D-methionine transport system ATP-binding protein [Paenibacillus eucommiae]